MLSRTQAGRRGRDLPPHPIIRPDRNGAGEPGIEAVPAASPVLGLGHARLAEVVVTRASGRSPARHRGAHPGRALAGQSGLPDAANLTVAFDNEIRPMQVEAAITAELRIVRLGYDPRSGRFDISLELPGSAIARKLPMRFTGSISETFEALVPTRAIAQGEVVPRSDLVPARRPKSEAAPNVIHEAEQAVGMVAKRALAPPARPSARAISPSRRWSLATGA